MASTNQKRGLSIIGYFSDRQRMIRGISWTPKGSWIQQTSKSRHFFITIQMLLLFFTNLLLASLEMSIPAPRLTERFSTLFTSKWLLSWMNTKMFCQGMFLSKSLPTLATCKRLLSRMDTEMSSQVIFTEKCLSTLATSKTLHFRSCRQVWHYSNWICYYCISWIW